MEQVLVGLALLLVVGSVCGLASVARIGSLSRRLAVLEERSILEAARTAAFRDRAVDRAVDRAGPVFSPPAAAPAPPDVVAAQVDAQVDARIDVLVTAIDAPIAAPIVPAAAPVARRAPSPAPTAPGEEAWWRAFELRAGTRWITWIGAAALVIGAALFVKLAMDEGWLGPAARLALGAAAGIGLLLAGMRAQRAEMRPLAHGLFGAGIGVLYVSTYVAFASHGLIPREVAFAAMVGVTVIGCALAIRHDAEAVAVLALLGGLITPVAVSAGEGSRDALFSYLMILDVVVVVLAMVRRWRALEVIAMAGTWVLFGGWLQRDHDPAQWGIELAWLAGFHLLFLVLPFGYHLRRSIALAPGRFRIAVANAALVAGFAAVIVERQEHVLGVIALVMAATYHALGAVVRRRLPGDGRAHFGFVALAVVLATSSVPLLLRDHGITLAWSLEAPVLLALGFHYRHFPIRLAGLAVLGLAVLDVVGAQWPHHLPGFTPFANLSFIAALAVPAGAVLFALVHHAMRRAGDARDRWLGVVAGLGALALTLALAHAELVQWYTLAGHVATARAVVPMLWALGALLAVVAAARGHRLGSVVAVVLAAIATRFVFLAYALPPEPAMLLGLNARFAGALLTCLAVAALARVESRRDRQRGAWIWATALSGLGIAIGVEAYLHFAELDSAGAVVVGYAGRRAQTALSIAWSGYAAVMLAVGFGRGLRSLRLAGLGLFGVVATKLVIADMAGAAPIYRVMSFLIVGALMIAASFAYHRFERR